MIEYKIILFFLAAPEIFFMLCLPFADARSWWIRMVEDSDNDPNHTDGWFIMCLFAALWCFRIGIIAGLHCIYFNKQYLDIAMAFLVAGGSLLGVRIAFKNRLISQPENKTGI